MSQMEKDEVEKEKTASVLEEESLPSFVEAAVLFLHDKEESVCM